MILEEWEAKRLVGKKLQLLFLLQDCDWVNACLVKQIYENNKKKESIYLKHENMIKVVIVTF